MSVSSMDQTRTFSRSVFAGSWWRFERYEISGEHISPAPDAQLVEYDPWEIYAKARDSLRKQTGRADAPFESLFAAVDRVGASGHTLGEFVALASDEPGAPVGGVNLSVARFTPDPETLTDIVDWCNRFGVLGVSVFHVRQITLAPRLLAPMISQGSRLPTQVTYFQSPEGWQRTDHNAMVLLPESVPDGELIPRKYTAGFEKPHVYFQDNQEGSLGTQPLSESWSSFFPGVPKSEAETYAYPQPLTPEFWQLYSEPLWDFIETARRLKQAFVQLGRARPERPTKNDNFIVQLGRKHLHAFLNHVHPLLDVGPDGTLIQRWCSTSLVGTLAAMILQDVTAGRRPQVCAACGKVFAAVQNTEINCSPKCRHRRQKRQQRQKAKRKQERRTKRKGR
jgi:hypothetical protein